MCPDWEDKFKDNLLEVLYRADQPRHPAGSPEGGRFAPAGGTGGSAGSPEERVMKFITGDPKQTRELMSKLSPERQESLAKAVESTLGQYGVSLEDIYATDRLPSGEPLSEGYLGFYVHAWNSVGLNETMLEGDKLESALAKMNEAFEVRRTDFLDMFGMPEHSIPSRQLVAGSVDDPFRAIISHECYHAVYRQHQLHNRHLAGEQGWWPDILQGNGVDKRVLGQVSDYAMSNPSEAFSEIGTAIDMGLSVPDSVRKSFDMVTDSIRVKG